MKKFTNEYENVRDNKKKLRWLLYKTNISIEQNGIEETMKKKRKYKTVRSILKLIKDFGFENERSAVKFKKLIAESKK